MLACDQKGLCYGLLANKFVALVLQEAERAVLQSIHNTRALQAEPTLRCAALT